MKKNKIFIVIAIITVLTISVMTVAFAIIAPEDSVAPMDRYDELSSRNEGYKERALKMGKTDVEDVEILYPSNETAVKTKQKNIKAVEEMEGYCANLVDNAYYLSKKTMTYGELLQSDEAIDLDPTIAKDRMVWVTKAMYPNNIIINGGYIENAEETKYWDAETGDFIGATIRSLNADGTVNPNGIHMGRPTFVTK